MSKTSFKTRKAVAEFLLEIHWLLLLVAFSFSVIFVGAKWSNFEEDTKNLGNLLEEIRNATLNSTLSKQEVIMDPDVYDEEDDSGSMEEYADDVLNKTRQRRTYLEDLEEARAIVLSSLIVYTIGCTILILSQTIINSILSEGIIKENVGYCAKWFFLQTIFNVVTGCIIIFGHNLSHSVIIEGIVLQWIWVGYIIIEINSYIIMMFYYLGLKDRVRHEHDVGIYIVKPQ